ncbi:hypothetical protein [Tenggerimyces flavus]|uniref:Glycosyltransferase RgtA/B/C/D-like domain-containing protein n=1 Tax=Tenggerimyces flavus TaxID=1708749 RepID=A0ABV7YIZ7_9ACTN|nr:hypothetical protein [Tenggerimyces flavus]MBM7789916.1 hypothetical protein [Tenggerimyces flavus]
MSVSLAPTDSAVDPDVERHPTPRSSSFVAFVVDLAGSFLVPLGAYLFHAALFGRWIVDDAAISFAYARNIAEGYGIVHQPGAESVEGYSNPLWTALLTVLHYFGVLDDGTNTLGGIPDYAYVPRAIAVVCVIVIFLCLRRIFGQIFPRRRAIVATLVAGLILAINPSFVGWTVSGMENPLYAALVALLAALLVTAAVKRNVLSARVAMLSSVLVLLLALTRPDGLIFVLAYPLLVASQLRRPNLGRSFKALVIAGATFAIPAAALLFLRYQTWGLLVPNTAVAKSQNGLDFAGLAKVTQLVEHVGWPVTFLALLLVGMTFVQLLRPAPTWRVSSAFKLGLYGLTAVFLPSFAAYALLNEDWMIQLRFATPFWVTSAPLLAALLVHWLAMPHRRTQVVVGVLTLAAVVPTLLIMADKSQTWRTRPTLTACFVAERYGRMWNTYADLLGIQNASYLTPDLGGTLLTSRHKIYDLGGLMDAHIARAMNTGDHQALAEYVFTETKPTFIHIHGSFKEPIFSDPRLDTDYLPIVPSQDYVRKDAVRNLSGYYFLRNSAPVAEAALWSWRKSHQLASCGPMTPGSPSRMGVQNP